MSCSELLGGEPRRPLRRRPGPRALQYYALCQAVMRAVTPQSVSPDPPSTPGGAQDTMLIRYCMIR
ncbi:hypothetical protein GCM10018790_54800 [Kitasatospora xanthocidica]|nr:hypothetical protein GCM10018790_54800 [Kitasatospora xanthocidica]